MGVRRTAPYVCTFSMLSGPRHPTHTLQQVGLGPCIDGPLANRHSLPSQSFALLAHFCSLLDRPLLLLPLSPERSSYQTNVTPSKERMPVESVVIKSIGGNVCVLVCVCVCVCLCVCVWCVCSDWLFGAGTLTTCCNVHCCCAHSVPPPAEQKTASGSLQ